MKRHLRLFQVLEEAASWKKNAAPPRYPVRDMLAIVRQKMRADTAALVLIGARSCRLITSASAEDTDERLDRRVRLIEVVKKLRARGLRSLLGVQLTARRARGTLYVGLRANREFTPAEIERLEILSATLCIHLDNAQRQAALQDRLDALMKKLAATLLTDAKRDLMVGMVATAAPKLRGQCRRPRPRFRPRMRYGRGRRREPVARSCP
jgi:hypothetical protein